MQSGIARHWAEEEIKAERKRKMLSGLFGIKTSAPIEGTDQAPAQQEAQAPEAKICSACGAPLPIPGAKLIMVFPNSAELPQVAPETVSAIKEPTPAPQLQPGATQAQGPVVCDSCGKLTLPLEYCGNCGKDL